MSINVNDIHLRDGNNAWVSLPNWEYFTTGTNSLTLDQLMQNAAGSSTYFGVCSTIASAQQKIVSVENATGTTFASTDVKNGLNILVKFEHENTASAPTLNVNGLGALPIYKYIGTYAGNTEETSWFAGTIISFTYCVAGSTGSWVINNCVGTVDKRVNQIPVNGSSTYPILLADNGNQSTETLGESHFATGLKYDSQNYSLRAEKFNYVTITDEGDSGIIAGTENEGAWSLEIPGNFELNSACEKTFTDTITAQSTAATLPTTSAVVNYVNNYSPVWYAGFTSDTTVTSTTKSISLPGYTPVNGARIVIYCNKSNTVTAPQLSINGGNPVDITLAGVVPTTTTPLYWDAGAMLDLVYSSSSQHYRVVSAPVSSSELTALINAF